MVERFRHAPGTPAASATAFAYRVVLAILLLLFVTVAPGTSTVWGQDGLEEIRIGYLLSKARGFNAADRSGALLGEQEINVQAGLEGKRIRLIFATGGRSSEVVAQAEELIAQHGVKALLGSVSGAATIKLSQLAEERGLIFFNIGSTVDSLRLTKCQPNTFSIGPSLSMGVRALGQWAVAKQKWQRWVLVVGESRIEARLAKAARTYLAAHQGSVAAEILIDKDEAHAPAAILSQITAADADFVFLAVTGEAQQLLLEGYRAGGYETPIGGSTPELVRFGRATQKMTGYWATGWSHLNRIYGATELNNRYVDFGGLPMTGQAWAAWTGVKILGETLLSAPSLSAADLRSYLRNDLQFDGYMGRALNFRPWNQQLRRSINILRTNHGNPWNGWDSLIPESSVPLRGLKGWTGHPMDSIGFTAQESECRLPQ